MHIVLLLFLSRVSHRSSIVYIIAALLAGCGGSEPPIGAPAAASDRLKEQ